MKIAVVGWYHKLNWGDEILENALTRLFSDCELTFWGHAPNPAALAGFDHVVVGGGSVWPNTLFDKYLETRDSLLTPFSLLGISARRSAGASLTQQVLADACAVVVRDRATRALLLDHPKVAVAPDLSWLYPLTAAAEPPRERIIGLNLRAHHRGHWRPEVIGEVVRGAAEEIVALPFYYGDRRWEGGRALPDREVLAAAGVMGPERSAGSDFQRVRTVVAMRFHALVLAAQAAIPFVGFDYHPKVVAFCKELGLEQYCVPLDNPRALSVAVAEVEARYDSIRAHLLAQRDQETQLARESYSAARNTILGSTRRHEAPTRRWLSHLLSGRRRK